MKPKIVIDKNIPFIQGVFEPFASVEYVAGQEITSEIVRDADALIIRTRTKCDAALLDGSTVQYIATATIGFNHIDTEFCRRKNICWNSAIGCNAAAVGQYVASALSYLALHNDICWKGKTIGIVGVGHVGREVEKVAQSLGLKILRNDPPRSEQEGSAKFVSLQTIQSEADIITFHTPLMQTGKYATWHLADSAFFRQLQKCPIIINCARGGIVDENALKYGIQNHLISHIVLDCWENEPNIDMDLLHLCDLATPHIAGYSADGKANATEMSVRAVARFFGFPLENFKVKLPPKSVVHYQKSSLQNAYLETYPIQNDVAKLRDNPKSFEDLRNHYVFRREAIIIP